MDVRLLALGAAWLLGWYLCFRVHGVPYAPEPGPTATRVAVVIPARDEEHNLPTVLAGLASQTAAPREVIVVDDGSTDTTAAVAAARGVEVLTGAPLPAGWTGKPWALYQGVRAAQAPLVVCLDADVDPSPHLLARLGHAWSEQGGLVSVQPYHEMRRWWERAAAFFNLVAVMGVGLASPGTARARARAAFGPCLIAPRDALLTHLDHRSVRRAILEDVALARRFAAASQPVRSYAGGDLVAFHMYERPGALVEGFTKNLAAGATTTPLPRLAAIVVWVAAAIAAGVSALTGNGVWLLVYAAFAVQCYVMLRQVGNFGIVAALLYPLLAVVFVGLVAASVVLNVRGHVRWKGRTVPLRGGTDRGS
jgi:4,4'-diaponeurosporenoate glycosyltransferase